MKKIFAVIMSAALIASVTVQAFAAGELSRVLISGSKSSDTISKTYPSGVKGTMEETEINKMMTELKNLTATKDVVQPISIESVSESNGPVQFWLKLELPERSGYSQAGAYSAVDYYSLKITDAVGMQIYSDETSTSGTGSGIKTINLGKLNENDRKEKKEYKLYISVNGNVNTASLTDKPSDVVWKLVYTDDASQFAASTPQPTVNTGAVTNPTYMPAGTPTVVPTPTVTPAASAAAKTIKINVTSKAEKTDKDKLLPGTYKLVGKGHATIEDKNGNKVTEFDLVTSADSARTLTLSDGDTVTVTGDADAYVQAKAPATATATAKPTATPKATAKPTATPKATVKPTATAKANPKTGDNAPIAVVSVIALLALGVIAYIGITSRKKSSK